MVPNNVSTPLIEIDPRDEKEEEDFELVRKTLKELIETGKDAVEDMHAIAKIDEKARSFEVVSTIIRTVAETSKDLYDLHKKSKEAKMLGNTNKGHALPSEVNIQNAVFVGSPRDRLKEFKKNR